MKILFLCTELADYSIASLRALKQKSPIVDICVVHFPINPEAPFKFELGDIGQFICVNEFSGFLSFKRALSKFKADKIVCSGWICKWYILFCLYESKRSFCILTSDNLWKGSIRQKMFRIIGGRFLRMIFKKIWVPGPPQVLYAKKVGYTENNILTGYYSCDNETFQQRFLKFRNEKRLRFPHRFVCVARYIPQKGYDQLWGAFAEWKAQNDNDWELWCAGVGKDFDSRMVHPSIKHLGFVQKEMWDELVSETGVFVLASLKEPWGVVVHEFVSSGYPLLVSNKVGATSVFYSVENGFMFDPLNKDQIIACFNKIASLSDDELYAMAENSFRISSQITIKGWADMLLTA